MMAYLDQLSQRLKSILANKYVIATGTVLLSSHLIVKLALKYRRHRRRQCYPKDVVILHQFQPGHSTPSASPYVLKLETWLRMANIKYQVRSFSFFF